MSPSSPLVSIITATYNRSNVLRYTISSVLNQTFQDWELIVVGDACTDDTEDVVASFNDPRIHFKNLSRNIGEQSGPNNEGFRLARGQYIAYLNHDDLWFSDHLATQLQGIEKTGADMVFSMGLSICPNERRMLVGAVPNNRYHPSMLVPASLWFLKREMIEEVGPWHFCRECYTVPSQDWLIRAWKAGKNIRLVPVVTVVFILSGIRPKVYARREYEENRVHFERMQNEPGFREKELTAALLDFAAPYTQLRIWTFFRRGLINIIKNLLLKCRIIPYTFVLFYRYRGRKGGYIDYLRKSRGLPKLK
jgi:glycosyltransferase involved in cell wall biosynthesis